MGNIIYPDGNAVTAHPRHGETFTVQELQDLLGGVVEILAIPGERRVMAILDDMHGLPHNYRASFLSKTDVAGAAFTCYPDEIEGYAEEDMEDRLERQVQAFLESATLHRDDPIF